MFKLGYSDLETTGSIYVEGLNDEIVVEFIGIQRFTSSDSNTTRTPLSRNQAVGLMKLLEDLLRAGPRAVQ